MNKFAPCLLGAVAGDIIGSAYEWDPVDTLDFPLFGPKTKFTDDTVLTVAVADHFVSGIPYAEAIHRYGNDYPHRGYGGNFFHWLQTEEKLPYNSFGNGSAMRVSAVGWVHNTLEETLEEAAASAEVTHNHPEGIKGAQAAAMAVFLARMGKSKAEIKSMVEAQTGYDLNRTLAEIRPGLPMERDLPGFRARVDHCLPGIHGFRKRHPRRHLAARGCRYDGCHRGGDRRGVLRRRAGGDRAGTAEVPGPQAAEDADGFWIEIYGGWESAG